MEHFMIMKDKITNHGSPSMVLYFMG